MQKGTAMGRKTDGDSRRAKRSMMGTALLTKALA